MRSAPGDSRAGSATGADGLSDILLSLPVDATHLNRRSRQFQDGFGLVSGMLHQTGASYHHRHHLRSHHGGGVQKYWPITVGAFSDRWRRGSTAGAIDITLAGTTNVVFPHFAESTVLALDRWRADAVRFQQRLPGCTEFIAYPTTNAGFADCWRWMAAAQILARKRSSSTSTTFAASQGYGMNLSGVNTTSERR